MLYTIAMILLILWLLGFTFHFFGEFIHVLFVLAIAAVLIRVIQGRKPL